MKDAHATKLLSMTDLGFTSIIPYYRRLSFKSDQTIELIKNIEGRSVIGQ